MSVTVEHKRSGLVSGSQWARLFGRDKAEVIMLSSTSQREALCTWTTPTLHITSISHSGPMWLFFFLDLSLPLLFHLLSGTHPEPAGSPPPPSSVEISHVCTRVVHYIYSPMPVAFYCCSSFPVWVWWAVSSCQHAATGEQKHPAYCCQSSSCLRPHRDTKIWPANVALASRRASSDYRPDQADRLSSSASYTVDAGRSSSNTRQDIHLGNLWALLIRYLFFSIWKKIPPRPST